MRMLHLLMTPHSMQYFDVDVSSWDVSNGVNFYGMFAHTEEFNQDLSKWDFSSAENIGFMFAYNPRFQTDASNWNTLNVVDMTSTFYSCDAFSSDLTKVFVHTKNHLRMLFTCVMHRPLCQR